MTASQIPEFTEFKHRFGDTPPDSTFFIKKYKEFILKIRKVYPSANIICSLGPMSAVKKGAPWSGYIKKAVEEINDNKIYTLFFPFLKLKTHPKIKEQKEMADILIKFIDDNRLL
jgi:hypothetical protein